jgi:hypothetical protein
VPSRSPTRFRVLCWQRWHCASAQRPTVMHGHSTGLAALFGALLAFRGKREGEEPQRGRYRSSVLVAWLCATDSSSGETLRRRTAAG